MRLTLLLIPFLLATPAGAQMTERELTIGAPPWQLGATLTLPGSATPSRRVPAVVLVHGSGPNDRNETIGPNQPFRQIAEALAAEGIAVLRYDKRTRVHGAQMPPDITIEEETLADAVVALDSARAQAEIDPARVFLLGHSLGGNVAPLIAARDPDLAGVILLAASARPMSEILLDQFAYLRTMPQNAAPAAQAQIDALVAAAERVRAREAAPGEMVLGAPAGYMYDLEDRDAPGVAATLDLPFLVIHGGRDYQVTDADLAIWREKLAPNPDVEYAVFADLNHLMHVGEGKATPQEYARAGVVDRRVIATIARFVNR